MSVSNNLRFRLQRPLLFGLGFLVMKKKFANKIWPLVEKTPKIVLIGAMALTDFLGHTREWKICRVDSDRFVLFYSGWQKYFLAFMVEVGPVFCTIYFLVFMRLWSPMVLLKMHSIGRSLDMVFDKWTLLKSAVRTIFETKAFSNKPASAPCRRYQPSS